MTPADFKTSVSGAEPAPCLPGTLQALWWAAKQDWHRAHALVQAEKSTDAASVHAYLHRVEGDLDNARYWYGQARQSPVSGPLEAEWNMLVDTLLRGRSERLGP